MGAVLGSHHSSQHCSRTRAPEFQPGAGQEQPVLAEEVWSALKEAGSIPPSAGEAHDVRGLVARLHE